MSSERFRAMSLLCVLFWLTAMPAVFGQTAEDVVRSLSERGQDIHTVQIQWKGQAFRSPDWEAIEAGVGGFHYQTVGSAVYDDTGRFRLEYSDAGWNAERKEMALHDQIMGFDGERATSLASEGQFGFPVFSEKSNQPAKKLSSTVRQLRFYGMNLAYRPLDPHFGLCRATDAGDELQQGEIEGQSHLILPFKNAQIWVDPARDLLPVRYQSYTDGQLRISVDVQYVNSKGAWQPASWSVQMFGDPGVVLRSYTETVTSYNTNVPIDAAVFTLSPPRGAYGTDYDKNERYLIRNSGEKRVLQPGEFSSGKYRLLLYDHYWWPAVITAAFAVFVFIACVVFYLRTKRHISANELRS